MEQEKKKFNTKCIILSIIVIAIIGIVISVLAGGVSNKDARFKEVAHICNNLGGLPGMQIVSPEVLDVWYFAESDNSAKDVIVCFTGENTSSKYYQYFMWNGESTDFVSMAYAKDEVHTSNIITKVDSDQMKLNCAGLMLFAMEEGNKLSEKQIKELNKLLSSGKIEKYKDYEIGTTIN